MPWATRLLRIRNTFKSDPNPVRTKNIYKKKILYFFLKILRTILQISCYECFMILIYMTFWCPRFCIHKNGRIQILQMYGSVSTTLIWRYKKVLKSSPRSFHPCKIFSFYISRRFYGRWWEDGGHLGTIAAILWGLWLNAFTVGWVIFWDSSFSQLGNCQLKSCFG